MLRLVEHVSDILKVGIAQHRHGNLAQAEEIYLEVLDNCPENSSALHLLGIIALQAGRAELAVDRISRAITLNASNASFHYNLGLALHRQDRPDEAKRCLRRALTLEPGHEDALNLLATVLGEQGETAELRRLLDARGCCLPVRHRLPASGGPETGRLVALTIDDGPTPEVTPGLLDLLARHGATATFFVTGERAARHPDLLRAIVDAGHGIQAHGYSHRAFPSLSDAGIRDEMERTETLLRPWRPTPATYPVRLPFGHGWTSARVHRALRSWHADCRFEQWTLDVAEWSATLDTTNRADAERKALAGVQRVLSSPCLDRTILLIHDRPIDSINPLSIPIALLTAARLLDGLAQGGYRVRASGPS